MKKIVFLGGKAIGKKCLEELFKRQNELECEIIAVGVSSRGKEIRDFCKAKGLRILENLDEFLDLDCDLLFSVQYHEILKPKHLACVKEMAFNLHLAPLPEYRGCNQFTFAILNDDKEFGVSIHRLEEGIDSGDMIFEKRFKIPPNCFVDELVSLANTYGVELFSQSLENLILGRFSLIPQSSIPAQKREFHLRKEIEKIKYINLAEICGGGEVLIEKIIRATAMPGFPSPYCFIGGRKFYFIQACDDEKSDS